LCCIPVGDACLGESTCAAIGAFFQKGEWITVVEEGVNGTVINKTIATGIHCNRCADELVAIEIGIEAFFPTVLSELFSGLPWSAGGDQAGVVGGPNLELISALGANSTFKENVET